MEKIQDTNNYAWEDDDKIEKKLNENEHFTIGIESAAMALSFPLHCEHMIVGTYGAPSAFLQLKLHDKLTYLASAKAQYMDNVYEIAKIYHIKLGIELGIQAYLVLISKDMREQFSFLLASQLLGNVFQAKRVTVLDTIFKINFENINDIEENAFLRCLSTTRQKQSNQMQLCDFLEPINTLTGISAAILTLAESEGLAAICYVGVISSYEVNNEVMEVFDKVSILFKFFDRRKVNEMNTESIKILKEFNTIGHNIFS